MQKIQILSVDDNQDVLENMRFAFANEDVDLVTVSSGIEAIDLVTKDPFRFAIAFIDQQLHPADSLPKRPEEQGHFIAKKIKTLNSTLTTVMVSADRSSATMARWLEANVDKFLFKPFAPHEVVLLARAAQIHHERYSMLLQNASEPTNSSSMDALKRTGLIGASKSTVEMAHQALQYAKSEQSILLLGETGTGKGLLARAIHKNSQRAKEPFVAINCSTYRDREQLLESELFGHEKGSFTGADRSKAGVFESASGGIIFLDEIHQLSPSAQAKLLVAVDEKKIRRVGGNQDYLIDVRIIAAGKPDLRDLCEKGTFLPDLYYRLCCLDITIPPLRARTEDIGPLITQFLGEIDIRERRSEPKRILDSVVNALTTQSWPGNIRELRQLAEKVWISSGPVIRHSDLPENYRSDDAILACRRGQIVPLDKLISEQETQQKELILRSLEAASGNTQVASDLLEIPRSTLVSKMKKLGVFNLGEKQRRGILALLRLGRQKNETGERPR